MSNKAKKLTLEDFRVKALKKYSERKKVAEIEIDGFGLLEFTRPSTNMELEYQNGISNAFKFTEDGEILSTDFEKLFEASKRLVYNCCPFLKDTELQESLEIADPFDTVIAVFENIETVNSIAEKINNVFGSGDIKKEVKN